MVDIARLEIQADSTGVRSAAGDLDRLTSSARGTEAQNKKLTSSFGSMSGMLRSLIPLFGGLSAAMAIREMARYTDQWTNLNARMVNAVKDADLADDVLNRISQTARRTYSSLQQTADTFLKNNMMLTELGYSVERQIDLNDALNNSLVISGTRGDKAASVMDAFSKALAFGELRGQNFNTVLQSGGRLVEALAAGLGVSTLQLREMSAAGELDTARVVNALTSQMEKLREEAELMPAEISDGFLLMGNSMMELVGRMDDAIGAGDTFAGVLVGLADGIGRVNEGIKNGDYDSLISRFIQLSKIVAAIVAIRMVVWLSGIATQMAINIQQAIAYQMALARMAGVSYAAATATSVLSAALRMLGGPVGAVMMGVAAFGAWAVSANSAERAAIDLDKANKKLSEGLDKTSARMLAESIIRLEEMNDIYAQISSGPGINQVQRSTFQGLIDANNQAINEMKAQIEQVNAYEKRISAITGSAGSGSPVPAGQSLDGLIQAESIMMKYRSSVEVASDEILKLNALWQGGLISLEAYTEHVQRAASGLGAIGNEKEIENIQRRMEAIRLSNLTEVESEQEKFAQILETKNLAFANGLLSEQQWHLELEAEYERHNGRLSEIEERESERRQRLAQQEAQNRQRILGGALAGLTTLMNSESKKMFAIGKVAAISQSMIATWQGMSEALKLGWPLGLLAAAAIGAAGFANVANIKKTSFGSTGGASGSVTAGISNASMPTQPIQKQQEERLVRVEGLKRGELVDYEGVVSIIEQMAGDGRTRIVIA